MLWSKQILLFCENGMQWNRVSELKVFKWGSFLCLMPTIYMLTASPPPPFSVTGNYS